MARSKRGFGTIERLPSDRYRAKYIGPDTARHTAPRTFTAKTDAEAWLTDERRLIERDEWEPPRVRKAEETKELETAYMTLADYAGKWLEQSHIGDSTKVGYEQHLRLRILPGLGGELLPSIDKAKVAAWWRKLNHTHERACHQSYSLLRTIMYAALDDGLVDVNPCRVKGAGKPSRRRSVEPLTPAQVAAVADAMPERWRLGVLLGAWCALRSGEIRELRRKDIDLDKRVIRVSRGVKRVGTTLVVGGPKTDAGRRTVNIPEPLVPEVFQHLQDFAQIGAEGLLFYGLRTGMNVRDGVWRMAWTRAFSASGLEGYRFHDLRHTGLTYAAVAGATIRELQAMAGHTTAAMAMRYQEVAADHMAEVVGRLGEVIESGRKPLP